MNCSLKKSGWTQKSWGSFPPDLGTLAECFAASSSHFVGYFRKPLRRFYPKVSDAPDRNLHH